MYRAFLFAALAAAMLFARAEAAPVEAYGKLPSVQHAMISPDGASLAIVASNGDDRRIAVQHLSDGAMVAVFDAGKAKICALQWAGNQHILVVASVTASLFAVDAPRQEWFTGLNIDLAKNTSKQFMTGAPDTLNTLQSLPQVREIDGRPVAFVAGVHFVSDMGQLSLFKVDLDSNTTKLVADGPTDTDNWLVDEHGAPLASAGYDDHARRWTLRLNRQGEWKTLKTVNSDFGGPDLLGLGRDGQSILLSDFDDAKDNNDGLREWTPGAQDWGPVFAPGEDEDQVFDPVTSALIGVHALVGDSDVYTFFNKDDQARWDGAVKAFPGQRVTLASMSGDHMRMIARVDSPTDGPAYALVDIKTGKANWIGPEYNDIEAGDVAPVRSVAFRAQDGLKLTGYLTTPLGRPEKALPLIVFPHGGPAARDEPGFDWWAQAMASRGYAVLQVNYRGSAGFGWAFLARGFGEWGRKMQTDLSDGVRYLAAQGVIDPKRVCIVGASYGGYAALAGAAVDTGVYRCAVSVSGISDMGKFIVWSRRQQSLVSQRYWDRYLGVARPDDPMLAKVSPAAHADAVTVPVLLIHGKDDTTVPIEQSQLMADALQRAGKPVEFVVLSGEDHYMSSGATRLQMLQATLDFLARNNPPDPAAPQPK